MKKLVFEDLESTLNMFKNQSFANGFASKIK